MYQKAILPLDNTENEYGILLKHVCGSCDRRFDKQVFNSESESESGYGSCPHCGSQYTSANFEEVDATPAKITIKIGDFTQSINIKQTHLRDYVDTVNSAGAPDSYSYLNDFLLMEYLQRILPKLGKKHTLEMLKMIIDKMEEGS